MRRPTRYGFRRYLYSVRKPAIQGNPCHCVLANYLHSIGVSDASVGVFYWRSDKRHTRMPLWMHRVIQRFDQLPFDLRTVRDPNLGHLAIPARNYRKPLLGVL